MSPHELAPVDKIEKLHRALERGRLDFTEIVAKARIGEVQFHENDHAVAVTALSISGPYRTCYVMAVAGDMAGVPDLALRIEVFAKAQGCSAIEMDGRPGWGKVYEKMAEGYSQVSVKYRKSIGD